MTLKTPLGLRSCRRKKIVTPENHLIILENYRNKNRNYWKKYYKKNKKKILQNAEKWYKKNKPCYVKYLREYRIKFCNQKPKRVINNGLS